MQTPGAVSSIVGESEKPTASKAARASLSAAGFRVHVVQKDTTDPDEDGKVLSQRPEAGAERPRGAAVTIVVGQLAEDKNERVHRYERTYGAFERTFTLPATVDPSAITAKYERGVLAVTLPKVEKAKPRTIQVEVSKA